MFINLSVHNAIVPYCICEDNFGDIWVASKGGLFKFDQNGNRLLFELKNDYPRKIGPYCSVTFAQSKIIYAFSVEMTTELKILDVDGRIEHQQFIDGQIFSMVASDQTGDIYLTKRAQVNETTSQIWHTTIASPLDWTELISSDCFVFQALCYCCPTSDQQQQLIVSTIAMPTNIYSNQLLMTIDINERKILAEFGSGNGQDEAGQLYFPRSIQRYDSDTSVAVLDKSGRIQLFNTTAPDATPQLLAKVDAYLGNGFMVRANDRHLIVCCSGLILDHNEKAACDDWLEEINPTL